jgi:hypothetical protein
VQAFLASSGGSRDFGGSIISASAATHSVYTGARLIIITELCFSLFSAMDFSIPQWSNYLPEALTFSLRSLRHRLMLKETGQLFYG